MTYKLFSGHTQFMQHIHNTFPYYFVYKLELTTQSIFQLNDFAIFWGIKVPEKNPRNMQFFHCGPSYICYLSNDTTGNGDQK